MSLSAATIDALVAAGVSAEQLAAAMKAELAEGDRRKAEKRAGNAARQARKRARDSEVTHVTRDDALHGVTGCDTRDTPLPLPPLPQTPSPPTPSPPDMTTRARGGDPEGFEGFWASYPRKVGKPKALAAYRIALRRAAGPDPPATILAGLNAHLPSWSVTEPDLVPHPTTWLNRDGWDDQPPSTRPRLINGSGSHSPGLNKLVAVAGAMRAARSDWQAG